MTDEDSDSEVSTPPDIRDAATNVANNLLPEKSRKQYEKTYMLESSSYQQIAQSSGAVSIDLDVVQVGSEPVGVRCPHCQEDVMTRASYRNTTLTHILALVLGILFWWMCCCFIPYVSKRWKNVEHNCPNCHKHLGVYTRTTVL